MPVWYGILGFNVPLDTLWVISETALNAGDAGLNGIIFDDLE